MNILIVEGALQLTKCAPKMFFSAASFISDIGLFSCMNIRKSQRFVRFLRCAILKRVPYPPPHIAKNLHFRPREDGLRMVVLGSSILLDRCFRASANAKSDIKRSLAILLNFSVEFEPDSIRRSASCSTLCSARHKRHAKYPTRIDRIALVGPRLPIRNDSSSLNKDTNSATYESQLLGDRASCVFSTVPCVKQSSDCEHRSENYAYLVRGPLLAEPTCNNHKTFNKPCKF